MKNALLALALFAFVGTASAHDDKDSKGKKAKKETCSAEMKAHCAMAGSAAGVPACCAKKSGKMASVKTTVPAATAAQKSL
ncbi:MAG TPA: hypothetical protein VF598_06995 [Hymenobacter sp.]